MLQNKLYVFCCPFFRTLTEFCIVSKGESEGSLRRKKKKKGKQKKIHDTVVGRRQPIDDLLQVKTNFCCWTVRYNSYVHPLEVNKMTAYITRSKQNWLQETKRGAIHWAPSLIL